MSMLGRVFKHPCILSQALKLINQALVILGCTTHVPVRGRHDEKAGIPLLFVDAANAASTSRAMSNIEDSNVSSEQAQTKALICRAQHKTSVFVYPFHFYRTAPFPECRRKKQLWTTLRTTR